MRPVKYFWPNTTEKHVVYVHIVEMGAVNVLVQEQIKPPDTVFSLPLFADNSFFGGGQNIVNFRLAHRNVSIFAKKRIFLGSSNY